MTVFTAFITIFLCFEIFYVQIIFFTTSFTVSSDVQNYLCRLVWCLWLVADISNICNSMLVSFKKLENQQWVSIKETILYIKQKSSFSQRFSNYVFQMWFCKDLLRSREVGISSTDSQSSRNENCFLLCKDQYSERWLNITNNLLLFHYSELLVLCEECQNSEQKKNGVNCRSKELTFISDVRNGLGLHVIVVFGCFSDISCL